MSTTFSVTSAFPVGPPIRSGAALHQRISWRAVVAPWRLIGIWGERRRQRRALGDLVELNDYLLKDIGLTREQARCEAAKPFWQA
jgi:uncharacterized protein YjiS (DUF1127 family)